MKSYKELAEEALKEAMIVNPAVIRGTQRLEWVNVPDIFPQAWERLISAVAHAIESHSTSLVRQLLESVGEKGTSSTCKQCDGDGCSRCFSEDGWNSCRETLIAKAIQLGVVEKE